MQGGRIRQGFNPLPSPKQGETHRAFPRGSQVSIRSPHRSKGRPKLIKCFNPLPSPKQGETADQGGYGVEHLCFNPLPSPKQGETFSDLHDATDAIKFQSAPLTEARGDPSQRAGASLPVLFQSAPLTEARGDPRRWPLSCTSWGFNPLPSPKQGETSRVRLGVLVVDVSIRSPHRSKGRPISWIVFRYSL